jgi:hypothetical protein
MEGCLRKFLGARKTQSEDCTGSQNKNGKDGQISRFLLGIQLAPVWHFGAAKLNVVFWISYAT